MDQTQPQPQPQRKKQLSPPLQLEQLRESRLRRHYRQRRRLVIRRALQSRRRRQMIKRLSRQSRQEHQPPVPGATHGREAAYATRMWNTACAATATTTAPVVKKQRGIRAIRDLGLNPIYLIRNWVNNLLIRILDLVTSRGGRSQK